MHIFLHIRIKQDFFHLKSPSRPSLSSIFAAVNVTVWYPMLSKSQTSKRNIHKSLQGKENKRKWANRKIVETTNKQKTSKHAKCTSRWRNKTNLRHGVVWQSARAESGRCWNERGARQAARADPTASTDGVAEFCDSGYEKSSGHSNYNRSNALGWGCAFCLACYTYCHIHHVTGMPLGVFDFR